MDSAEFKKLVTEHFAPKIRTLGWKGSGFHYRKVEANHVVKIFGLHGTWMGGTIYCETAIHFDFIPDLAGNPHNKTTFASCIIRERLFSDKAEHYITISEDKAENIKKINKLWEEFQGAGQAFYRDFDTFPETFASIKPKHFNQRRFFCFGPKKRIKILNKYFITNEIHLAWLLKEINLFIGRSAIAKEFADLGMQMINESASKWAKEGYAQMNQSYLETITERFKIK